MPCLAKSRWPLAIIIGLSLPRWTIAQSITSNQLQQVVARLAEGATHSWELGTRAQALLELNSPFYSVFSNTTLPPPTSAPSSSIPANLTDVITIARNTVSQLNGSTTTPRPLVANDGAAGDPASIGVAVLLANWTNAPPPVPPVMNVTGTNATTTTSASPTTSTTNTTNTTTSASPTSTSVTNSSSTTHNLTVPSYAEAATSQLEFLLTTVPRTSDGAISHRVSQVQLWSDFIYMAPPFLAYYGVITQNQSLVTESYNQIKLYRSYLRDPNAHNLWMHIVMGAGNDSGHWSTGNGWAASGMLRVLATIKNSNFAHQLQSEQTDITNWVVEILDGMYSQNTTNNIFHNYADNTSTFSDCSGTALIAAATYRLAVLTHTLHNIPNAEKSRKSLSDGSHVSIIYGRLVLSLRLTPRSHTHGQFDPNGWLTPVVNPEDWSSSGSESPEGQAFVVEMQSAWQDWVAAGSPGANSAKMVAAAWPAVIACVIFVISVI
ncbi:Six-hairpin glycosidase-like protein [Gautieria morchelliformis]|nr:Six-hairpin glycosidase-like protein [Gautieria morchelliformis]